MKVILAYVPVLHEGYRRFFEKHKDADRLLLLSDTVAKTFVPLAKDIRALPAEMIRRSLSSWGMFQAIDIADEPCLKGLEASEIVMPDEDTMHDIHKAYFPQAENVIFDSVFLRWDKHKSTENKAVEADQKVSADSRDIEIIALLAKEAEKSSDWWRHIGAAIVKNGEIMALTHNHHVPSQHMPYTNGDPRADFHKGINLELSTGMHAEASLVADAARRGSSLEGASLYVNTFPCPPCAKLIAYSGIKKLYYTGGYGVLDGESILKSRGVEIIFVDTNG